MRFLALNLNAKITKVNNRKLCIMALVGFAKYILKNNLFIDLNEIALKRKRMDEVTEAK